MSLTERIDLTTNLTRFPGEIPVNYLYTYGLAGEDFFRALKEKGKLTAARCEECGVAYFPSRVFCERCMTKTSEPFEVAPEGEVFSFTVCHENMDGSRKSKPEILAAVQLDGTDTVFVHHLAAPPGLEPAIGMRVEAVLKAKKDREGNLFDILHFRPCR